MTIVKELKEAEKTILTLRKELKELKEKRLIQFELLTGHEVSKIIELGKDKVAKENHPENGFKPYENWNKMISNLYNKDLKDWAVSRMHGVCEHIVENQCAIIGDLQERCSNFSADRDDLIEENNKLKEELKKLQK